MTRLHPTLVVLTNTDGRNPIAADEPWGYDALMRYADLEDHPRGGKPRTKWVFSENCWSRLSPSGHSWEITRLELLESLP